MEIRCVTGDWTTQLAADHAPPPVGWWPPAPGWWGVAAVCLLLIIVWSFARYRLESSRSRLRRPSPRSLRQAALLEIERIERSPAEDPIIAQEIETALRRYAVALFGPERVARLTGASWLQFLGQNGGALLAGDTGRTLLEAAFARRAGGDRASWFRASRQFVELARNESG